MKLDNPKCYTGLCLRRTSSTILVEEGTTFETENAWKVEKFDGSGGIHEEIISSKNKIAQMIATSVTSYEMVKNSIDLYPHEQISGEHSLSDIREAQKIVTRSLDDSVVGSAMFSGKFDNCNFYFGNKD